MTQYQPNKGEFYVYILCNPLKDGCPPFYVGKGKGDRAFAHLQLWPSDKHNFHKSNTIRRIRQAGYEPVISIAWSGADERRAFNAEVLLIAVLGRKCDGTGVLTNLTKGGDGLNDPSQETRQRISDGNRGKKISEVHRRKLIEANVGNKYRQGHIPSEETRRKLSEATRGRNFGWKFTLGHIPSEETRRKISLANRGHAVSEGTRRKMSEAHKGMKRTFSEEHCRKLSEAAKRRYATPNEVNSGECKSAQSCPREDASSSASKPCNIGEHKQYPHNL